jgi:hypothetical protein
MSRIDHDLVNAALRSAMARALVDPDGGPWAMYGWYSATGSAVAHWCTLDGLGDAVYARVPHTDGPDALLAAVASVAADMPPGAYGVAGEGLQGVALIATAVDLAGGRTCIADAAMVDGYRHTIKWEASEAVPFWTIYGPADRQRLDDSLPTLLASLQRPAIELPSQPDGQHQLSAQLRQYLADGMSEGFTEVFLILSTGDGWELQAPRDLNLRLADKVRAGAAVSTALAEVTTELAAERTGRVIPGLVGAGLITHVDHGDAGVLGSLAAYCDRTVHSATWAHHDAEPTWEFVSDASDDPRYSAVAAVFQRLIAAINGAAS